MIENKKVSIVTPFFNEKDSIDLFYREICLVIKQVVNIDFEVICVDDGSSDETLARLVSIANSDSRFIVIELSRNYGKEAALTAGIDAASGDAVIPIDADLQDPPELIQDMILEWINGAEVVLARRIDRTSDSLLKRKTAELFYKYYNYISDIEIPSNVGDFRLLDRIVVDAVKNLPERQRFMKGIFAWVGFRTVILDYKRKERKKGKTSFSWTSLFKLAVEGITSFSTAPLRIWSVIGIFGSLFSLTYAFWIAIRTMVYGIDIPGYASLLIAIIFFGSMQLVSVGVLGEYIGRIYIETKKRPLYIVRKQYKK